MAVGWGRLGYGENLWGMTSIPVNVSVTGVSATASTGSLSVVAKANVTPTGIAATTSTGTATVDAEANLTLTGGNIIGVGKNKASRFILGDHITLGANATIIGPLELKNNIFIGAGACVTKSFESSNINLVGVPAKVI